MAAKAVSLAPCSSGLAGQRMLCFQSLSETGSFPQFARGALSLGFAFISPLKSVVKPSVSKRTQWRTRPCRALAVPEAIDSLVTAGVSILGMAAAPSTVLAPAQLVLGPLAAMDEPTQWRVLLATALSVWYLTAKPGPLQGLLDLAWAPVSEKSFRTFDPAAITVGKQLGEGSFGVVFEGTVEEKRTGKVMRVILKKVKSKVSGAEEMGTSELYFNQRLQRTAKGSCAEFLGTCHVDKPRGKLVQGCWLVWRYQGSLNLEAFLRRRDFPAALARDLLGERGTRVQSTAEDLLQRDTAVVQAITRHVLESLKDIHATGVVHRDVKPLNMILDEHTLRFKLIDLGACVDLRTGFNYVPDETIMDPIYCAPEEYILPINTPNAPPGPLMSLLAPLLFMAHTPDKFDLFSAGLVLMQMAVPTLRYDRNLAQFKVQLAASGHDLDKWRRSKLFFAESELAILDANGGEGWDLARSLLRPRDGLWCPRPTAAAALKHRFLTRLLRWNTLAPPALGKAASGKSGKERAGSKGGKRAQEPALAPALNFGGQSRSGKGGQASRGISLPFFSRSEGPKLADAGAKFDRKVKLKAQSKTPAAAPQSGVAWSALLPLARPFSATPVTEAAPSNDPLTGLKRLVGLDGGALPTPPEKTEPAVEFPHVAALARLLGQAFLHQQVPVGLQSLSSGRVAKQGSGDKTAPAASGRRQLQGRVGDATAEIAQRAFPWAAPTSAAVGCCWLAAVAVRTGADAGSSLGQGMTQGVGTAMLLALAYFAVVRPGASRSRPSSAFRLDAVPLTPAYAHKEVARLMHRAGFSRAKGMAAGYTQWIVDHGAKKGSAGLVSSVREMERQLASLEATISGGREFNVAQKALLSRVQGLLLEATLRPAQGKQQVP